MKIGQWEVGQWMSTGKGRRKSQGNHNGTVGKLNRLKGHLNIGGWQPSFTVATGNKDWVR